MWKMWFWIVILLLIAGVFAEVERELHTFCITRYKVLSPKWNGEKSGKIIFLSDLHNHEYGLHNKKLIDKIRMENPELILIGGDILVGKEDISYESAAKFVEAICKIAPVYYANGNHEQRMKEKPEKYGDAFVKYKKRLLDAGVYFLENESAEVDLDRNRLCLTGLELQLEVYEKMKTHKVTKDDIAQKVGQANREEIQILLAHNPEYMEAYQAWGADITLSGHLHGGLICLPNGKSVITPQFHLFPKHAGEMKVKGNQTAIVSRGLGTHTVNIRLFNPAELIVFQISKQ